MAVAFRWKGLEELYRGGIRYRYVQLCDPEQILRREISLHGDGRDEDEVFEERSLGYYQMNVENKEQSRFCGCFLFYKEEEQIVCDAK